MIRSSTMLRSLMWTKYGTHSRRVVIRFVSSEVVAVIVENFAPGNYKAVLDVVYTSENDTMHRCVVEDLVASRHNKNLATRQIDIFRFGSETCGNKAGMQVLTGLNQVIA